MASIRESGNPPAESAAPPHWLMEAAITRIHEGALPREMLPRVLAGPGRQQVCSLCDHRIETGDVGYAVEPEPDAPLHFHVSCYRAWAKACTIMLRSIRSAPVAAPRFASQKRSGP